MVSASVSTLSYIGTVLSSTSNFLVVIATQIVALPYAFASTEWENKRSEYHDLWFDYRKWGSNHLYSIYTNEYAPYFYVVPGNFIAIRSQLIQAKSYFICCNIDKKYSIMNSSNK